MQVPVPAVLSKLGLNEPVLEVPPLSSYVVPAVPPATVNVTVPPAGGVDDDTDSVGGGGVTVTLCCTCGAAA